MTTVNVTEDKYSVSVTEGVTTVVTVKTPGPQGAGISAGDKGALTVAANLTDWTLNDSVVTNAKVSASAAIDGTKISPLFNATKISSTRNTLNNLNNSINYHLNLSNPANDTGEAVGLCFGLSTGEDIGASIYHKRLGANSYGDLIFATKPEGGNLTERLKIAANNQLDITGNLILNSGNITISAVHPQIFLTDIDNNSDFKIQNLNGVFGIRDQTNDVVRFSIASDGTATLANNLIVSGDLTVSEHIALPDNKKLQLGDSQDLTLSHNGSDSKITNITGNLLIEPKTNETAIRAIPDGATELFFNNSLRLGTRSWGVEVPGQTFQAANLVAFGGYVHVNQDNQPVKIGLGGDLSLLHDGTDSKITNITGNLLLEAKASQTAIKIIPDGNVELSHSGTTKLNTSSSGITVQGSVTTEDMNMSNLNGTANEVDNTKGSWSIQEGADDLFIINRVSGKKYKFNLTEIS